MRPASVVSIELLLDAATEARVSAEWGALAAAGIHSLAAHTGASNRPHVTLLVRPSLDRFAAPPTRGSFTVTLGAPVLFGSGTHRVLARSVIPSAELLALHAAVHEAAGAGDDAPHTVPGAWTPHVTLARRLRTDDLPAALETVTGDIQGSASTLRRWDAATKTVTGLGAL